MTAITDKANLEYRDMESPGSSVPNEPDKPGIRELFSVIDVALGSLGVNGAITVKKATKALLDADLAHVADTLAVVYNDATSANNGIYAKVGGSGSGSWAITALALPASFSADLATVLAQIGEVSSDAAAAAASAASAASDSQDAAEARGAAEDARDEALAAAEATGPFLFYNTKALANAALSGLANGQQIQVWNDESLGNAHTVYVKTAGVYVFLARLSVSEARLTTAFGEAHPKSLLGNLTTQSIDTNLNGSAVPADIGQMFIGNTVASADAITIDSGPNFPPGVAFRKYLGTPSVPTAATTSNLQLGYLDYRAFFEGEFYNAASHDVVIDGSRVTTTGCPPPTKHRWAVSDGLLVYIPMELWSDGSLQIGANAGEDYYGPSAFGNVKLWVNTVANDWVTAFAAQPATGAGYALRVHTKGETSSDYLLGGTSGAGSGTFKFSVRGNGDIYNGATKILGAQVAALPADATDLASALTLLNALKAGVRSSTGHGLFAG